MQATAKKLYNKNAAAERLGIKWRRLDYFREQGELAYVKIGGKVLFLESDLDEFINKHRIVSFRKPKNQTRRVRQNGKWLS
jgi:excisionase family DNA binding protein